MNHPTLANTLEQCAMEGNSDDYPKPNNLIPVTSCSKKNQGKPQNAAPSTEDLSYIKEGNSRQGCLRWTYLKLVTFLYNVKL